MSRSDHKHELSAAVERSIEQIPAISIKTNDLRIDDTTRTWVDATDSNHGFSLFTEKSPLPTDAELVAATYSNPLVSVANTTTRYIVARVDVGTHPGDFRLFEEDLPNNGTATVVGSNFRHLHNTTLYDYYGFAIRVQVVRTFTLEEHELAAGNTHYRGGTIAEQAVVDASGFDRTLDDTVEDAQALAEAVDDLKIPTDNTLHYDSNDDLAVNVQDVIEHLQERIRHFTSSINTSDAGASIGHVYTTSAYRKLITKVDFTFAPASGSDSFRARLVELNSDNSIKEKLFTSSIRPQSQLGTNRATHHFVFHDVNGDPGVIIGNGIRLGVLLSRLEDDSDSAVHAIHGAESSASPETTYDNAVDDFTLVNAVVYQHIDPAVGASTHSHDTQIRGNIKIYYTLVLDHGNLVGDGNVNAAHINSGSAGATEFLGSDGSGGAEWKVPAGTGGGGGTDDQTAAEVTVDTTNFSQNLTSTDDSVQDALETIDSFSQYQGAWQQASWPAGVIVTRSGVAYLSLVNSNTEIPTPFSENWSAMVEGLAYRGEAPVLATSYSYGQVVLNPDNDNYYYFTSTISASVARADIATHANFHGIVIQATEANKGGVRGASALQAISSSGTDILGWSVNRMGQFVSVALPTMAQSDIDNATTGRKAVTGALIAANAGSGGGGGTAPDRIVLADAVGVSNTAGPHEITLTEAMVARQWISFFVFTICRLASNPDGIGYLLSDDILALTAEATAPTDAENGIASCDGHKLFGFKLHYLSSLATTLSSERTIRRFGFVLRGWRLTP